MIASDANGELANSPLQQSTDMVNAYAVFHAVETGCADHGMDVSLDLQGVEHYGGPINQRQDGSFYLMDPASGDYDLWVAVYSKGSGYLWSDGYH